jgi:hypothetical protein
VGSVVIRLGIIGFSEGNGHPFSFASIVNGYNDNAFAGAGWPVIHRYLQERHPSEFATRNARVVAAWMPSAAMCQALCAATRIQHICTSLEEMHRLDLDGVMILRDDAQSHREIAEPFLHRGVPTFVDKPLTLNMADLGWFRPYLESGLLMTSAGLRYARELDALRAHISEYGRVQLVRATVMLDWERYGIHMVEAALGVLRRSPVAVEGASDPDRVGIRLDDGTLVDIACLGNVPKLFRFELFGAAGHFTADLHDNFTAFSRLIGEFVRQVETRVPSIAPEDTVSVIKSMIAGRVAMGSGARVVLSDLES